MAEHQTTESSKTAILRVRQGDPLPGGWRVRRILAWHVIPNNDGGTGAHYEYDVEVEAITYLVPHEDEAPVAPRGNDAFGI